MLGSVEGANYAVNFADWAHFANGNVYDTRADGVEVSYGSKIQLKGFAGKATDAGDDSDVSYGNYAGAELTGDFNKLGLTAGYVNFKDMGATTGDARN